MSDQGITPPAASVAAPQVQADPRRWKALIVLSLMQFILVLDITVVNVALPHIRADLGFTRASVAWVVDGYVLTAGGLLLLGGRLADLLGRRRMFLIGISLFAVASVLSGAAVDGGMLVASRFLQGAGEALAAPAALGLIALLFPDSKERAKAIGAFGGVAGLGGTLGPVISGLILNWLSWRWIFYINIPVAAFCVFAVLRLVDESRATLARQGRPDFAGAVLITAGLSGIVYGLIQAANHPWGNTSVVAPLVTGIALIVVFVIREATAGNPLVPLRFFNNRTRVSANIATLFFTSAFFTLFYLLTFFLQTVHGYSALKTGVAYLPFGIVIGGGIGVSAPLVNRLGVKPLLGIGFLFSAGGILWLSFLSVHGGYWTTLFPGMCVMAFGAGMSFAGLANASIFGVTGEDAGLASGVQQAVQQVGGALGLSLLVVVALRHASTQVAAGVSAGAAFTSGTALAFRVGAGILVAGAVVVLFALQQFKPTEEPSLLLVEEAIAPA